MVVQNTPKKIGNVFGEDKLRLGKIYAREKRVGFKVVVIYCFEGVNKNRPAFFGWCEDIKTIENHIQERYPNCFFTRNTPFDDALDGIEKQLQEI
jgi:hypothetical protein